MSKTWILGPCSIENADLFIGTLAKINEVMKSTDDWYMKASFDKANRTSLHGGRGPGMSQFQSGKTPAHSFQTLSLLLMYMSVGKLRNWQA